MVPDIFFLHVFCLSSESRSNRREPVHGGRTPSAPLSPAAQRLLKEFGLRYGVVRVKERIVCCFTNFVTCHFVELNFRENSFAEWSTWITWRSLCFYTLCETLVDMTVHADKVLMIVGADN